MHDQSQLFYVIAAVNAALCLVFLWRTAHFLNDRPDCERLEVLEGRITAQSARSCYGTPELNVTIGGVALRAHSGPWLAQVRRLARERAAVRAWACLGDPRSRLWELWAGSHLAVSRQDQEAHSRGVARATATMSFLFAVAGALFFGARWPAASRRRGNV